MDEQSIFNEALNRPSSADRIAWIDEACGDDRLLKQRIPEQLLRHKDNASGLRQPEPDLKATVLTCGDDKNVAASTDAGLAPVFAKDAAVVTGNTSHSVLPSFEATMDFPRVVLQASAKEGDDPITQPNSTEMPVRNSINRYRLDGEIARGGMGVILKGRDTDLSRDLAIKVLLECHKDRSETVQRFVEEAQIGGQLQHPGIAPVHEMGQFPDGRPFFAMKLVKGETLSKLLKEREDSASDRGKFIGIFEQMCQTMGYVHARGVIHRDLKSANIMVGAFGEVQVMDWGLAKVLPKGGVADEKQSKIEQQEKSVIQTLRSGVGSDSPGPVGSIGSNTVIGSVMGTPAYMPPEQALGEIDLMNEQTDVFGLGAILCEILTGQPPYVGKHALRHALQGKLDDCMARLDACGADADLINLAKHCLNLEPNDRPRDAGVLADRVTGYLESVETRLRKTEMDKVDAQARLKSLFAVANCTL